jgi:hypothetical protein
MKRGFAALVVDPQDVAAVRLQGLGDFKCGHFLGSFGCVCVPEICLTLTLHLRKR